MWPPITSVRSESPRRVNHWLPAASISSSAPVGAELGGEPVLGGHPGVRPGDPLGAVLVARQLPELPELVDGAAWFERHGRECIESQPYGTGLEADQTLAERPQAEEEGARQAPGCRGGRGPRESEAGVVSLVTAIHLYVTDLDRSNDWYTRLLGRGPAAAYDEGENAHSAFFILEGQTFLVLTWDPERGREIGGSSRLELAAEDIQSEIDRLDRQGIEGGRITQTRFGTEVYDLADPDGHLVRIGPAWTLHAIEGAV